MKTSLSYSLKRNTKVALLCCFLILSGTEGLYAQSCTGTDLGTVGSTNTCVDFDAISAGSGSASVCTGNGFGGSGCYSIIRFRTTASTECVSLDITGLAGSNGTEITLWSGCASGTPSSYVSGSSVCYSDAASVGWSTAGLGLSANTSYYLRVWTKNTPTSSATACAHTQTTANDLCAAPVTIGTIPASYDNYCMTAGSPGDPPASQFCAFTLENNAWYSFTTLPTCTFPCSITIDITSISCSGGGNGFQIGWWSGSCGSLTNIGCSSGSGGSVTATINNLGPSQTLIVGIDGNAGSYCNFRIAGTGISALPVSLVDFNGIRTPAGVTLSWQTLSEENNAYFTIERSANGESWTELYRNYVDAHSHTLKEYEITDAEAPREEVVYYRLSQTDQNGKTQELKTISVDELRVVQRMKIVPNPVTPEAMSITVSIDSDYDTQGVFSLKDNKGRVLYSQESGLVKGSNTVTLDYDGFQSGVYFLEFTDSELRQVAKFIRL
jgi:hypothetical protein